MEGFLFQATIFLAAAVIAVPIAARLGLGSVLGYLAAGVLIGPVLGLVGGHETGELQHFAEFGVVMMLFLIGLELEPRALWDMRHRLLGLGGLQVAGTALAMMAVAMLMGYDWRIALAIGLIFALSSTAIVLQTLSEKGLMQTGGGRSAFSVLLTQDMAVIPMLAFLPLLAMPRNYYDILSERMTAHVDAPDAAHAPDKAAGQAEQAASAVLTYLDNLQGWAITLITIGAIAAIILAGIYLTRPVFRYIHAARLREMYTALALLIVVSISFLMYAVNLSPALGAFLAGVVLANSEFRHELESDLEPFKGLLLGLFFITVGAGFDVDTFLGQAVLVLALTLVVIAVKGSLLYILGRMFRLRGRNLWLFTLSLAQAGEFGFVLTSFATKTRVLPPAVAETLLQVIAMSMLITPLLFLLYDWISNRTEDATEQHPHDEIDSQGPVIIAGIGRFGQIVDRLVRGSGFSTIVMDNRLQAVQRMRSFGVRGFFGDPTRPDLLKAAGLDDARVLVAAMDNPQANYRLVANARRERPDLTIVARAHDRQDVFRLYQAGADHIVREVFDSSLRAGRYVLENMGLSEYEADVAERQFYEHDRDSVKELAELWDPDTPTIENQAYLDRARQIEAEMQTMLLSSIERAAEHAGNEPERVRRR